MSPRSRRTGAARACEQGYDGVKRDEEGPCASFGNAGSGWLFRRFRDDDGGAVSVEFLIVTAATVSLGVAAAGLVGAGVENLSGKVSGGLSETASGDEGRGGGNGALEDDEPSGDDGDDAAPKRGTIPVPREDGSPGDREADRDDDRDDDRTGKNGGKAQPRATPRAMPKARPTDWPRPRGGLWPRGSDRASRLCRTSCRRGEAPKANCAASRQLVSTGRSNEEDTMSRAFVFPGQGAQTVGMGKDLADAYPEARAVFAEVDEALDESLSRLIWDGARRR